MSEERNIDGALDHTADGIDMDGAVEVLSCDTVYTGAIFHVEDMTLRLPATPDADGTRREGPVIRRQVLRHAPCVVMLVHDTAADRYLIEREYRIGCDRFAYGLPAGLMDAGEGVEQAALRELAEETGVAPEPGRYRIEQVADCWSSEGMTDELAHIMVIHMDAWRRVPLDLDRDEHVASGWIDWAGLKALDVTASNSIIAIQRERLRRQRAGID